MIIDTHQRLLDLFKELKNLVTKEKEQTLIEKATVLLNIHKSFLEDTEKNYNKLLEYQIMLEDYTMWKSKEQYFKVTNNFVNSSISGDEFCDIFQTLCEENRRKATEEETMFEFKNNLSLTSQINGFSEIIESIYYLVDLFDPELEDSESSPYGLSENLFKSIIEEESIPKLSKYYETNCNVSRDLSQLVDQLNWENQDQYIELINEFLNGSSNFLNFKERYQSIVRVGKELESNSISLKINYQALGFSNYILILIQLFDSYQIDSKISSKVFKSWVRILLFEMKNHYSSNSEVEFKNSVEDKI